MKFKLDVTVEPVIFLIALSNSLSYNGQVNLILDKLFTQHVLYISNGTFNSSDSYTEESSGINTIKSILKECLPAIPLLFAGSWRDKHGKNIPLLIFVVFGQCLGASVNLLSAILWESFPILETVITEAVVTGLTGSLPLLLMSSACFVTCRTTVKDRTYRISLVVASYLGGATIGLAVGGIILQNLGFIPLFSLALISATLSLLYAYIFIAETPTPSKEVLPIWSMFKTLFKKREQNFRAIVLLMILSHCLIGSSLVSESTVFIFFLEKSLHMSVSEAGIYYSYKSTILTLSTFIVVPVLSNYFRMNDVLLGILSASVGCLSSVWAAFSTTRLQLALCPLADFLRGGIFAVERSIITKSVPPDEIGQIFSAEAVLEACGHLIFLPLYNFTYSKTSGTFPGAFFLLSASCSLVILFAFCITRILVKEPKLDEVQTK